MKTNMTYLYFNIKLKYKMVFFLFFLVSVVENISLFTSSENKSCSLM